MTGHAMGGQASDQANWWTRSVSATAADRSNAAHAEAARSPFGSCRSHRHRVWPSASTARRRTPSLGVLYDDQVAVVSGDGRAQGLQTLHLGGTPSEARRVEVHAQLGRLGLGHVLEPQVGTAPAGRLRASTQAGSVSRQLG
jgi:hypothetical protein